MPAKKTSKKMPDFETAMKELEVLVERMEQGELTLENALKEFERGVTLSRFCQKSLAEAEQRVKLLTTDGETDFEIEVDQG